MISCTIKWKALERLLQAGPIYTTLLKISRFLPVTLCKLDTEFSRILAGKIGKRQILKGKTGIMEGRREVGRTNETSWSCSTV